MTHVAVAPAEARNRWRHELSAVAHRLAVMREAIGVLGAMPAKGSLEGLVHDLEQARHALDGIRGEAEAIIRQVREGEEGTA